MSEKLELSEALSILRKYNMPVSPILEYAIQERIDVLGGQNEIVEVPITSVRPPITVSKENSDYSLYSLKEGFERYLYENKTQLTARNYLRYLEICVCDYIKKYVDENVDSIYSLQTHDDVRKCIDKLKCINDFMSENARRHGGFTAPLNSYLKYLIERGL